MCFETRFVGMSLPQEEPVVVVVVVKPSQSKVDDLLRYSDDVIVTTIT